MDEPISSYAAELAPTEPTYTYPKPTHPKPAALPQSQPVISPAAAPPQYSQPTTTSSNSFEAILNHLV